MCRTRPFASIACSTSSRRRRMRVDSRDANSVSAPAPTSGDREHQREQAAERAIALREHGIRRLLGDDRALHAIADPDRMRCGDDRHLAVARRPPVGREDAGERAVDFARERQRTAEEVVAEVLGRLLQHQRVQRIERVALDRRDDAREARRRRVRRRLRPLQRCRRARSRSPSRRRRRCARSCATGPAGSRRSRARAPRRRAAVASLRERLAGRGRANSAGRSCSAVATACAVPASVRSCDSRRNRSSSCTYA